MLRLRLFLAAGAIPAMLLGGLAACGMGAANASFGNPGPGSDSGATSEDATSGDSGSIIPPDSGVELDAESDGGARPTRAVFVHASPDLPDLRLCWWLTNAGDAGGSGASGSDAGGNAGDASNQGDDGGDSGASSNRGAGNDPPFPWGAPAPMSDYPAIPVGADVPLPDASSLVGGDLTVVAINAGALAGYEPPGGPSFSCWQVLNPSSATVADDILYKFRIPAGAIVAGATNVIAITGCYAGDNDVAAERCGAGFSPSTGNVHAQVTPVFDVQHAGGGGQIPVQAALLSAGIAAQLGPAGAVVSYGAQDAAAPVATLAAEGAIAPSSPDFLDAVTTAPDYGRLGFALDFTPASGASVHAWFSLEQMLALIDPDIDPTVFYAQPTTYVVAVVGDTAGVPPFSQDAGAYDGRGLHLLAVPMP